MISRGSRWSMTDCTARPPVAGRTLNHSGETGSSQRGGNRQAAPRRKTSGCKPRQWRATASRCPADCAVSSAPGAPPGRSAASCAGQGSRRHGQAEEPAPRQLALPLPPVTNAPPAAKAEAAAPPKTVAAKALAPKEPRYEATAQAKPQARHAPAAALAAAKPAAPKPEKAAPASGSRGKCNGADGAPTRDGRTGEAAAPPRPASGGRCQDRAAEGRDRTSEAAGPSRPACRSHDGEVSGAASSREARTPAGPGRQNPGEGASPPSHRGGEACSPARAAGRSLAATKPPIPARAAAATVQAIAIRRRRHPSKPR